MFHARFATNCLAALWLFAPAMHASIITFVATGVTQSGSTLSGDVVINTTTGSVSSLSLTMSSPLSFTANTLDSIDTGPASGFYVIEARNGTTFPFISLDIPTATLVGYTGGSMCTVGSTCPNGISFSEASSTSNATTSGFVSGSLTASPEPSSLALVGGAMLGLAAWRRRRSAR
ncbi:MAG TPA: PEP-CTERM sorting domain-containing protein [Bryobacteraceae bacterium]|nr:PEP-CTERM sorting domain-containing protein [Bryobacteraceae bacterium]